MKQRLFLDSSVVIAALLSTSGGSFRIFKESNAGNIETHINRYVLAEVTGVVARKHPSLSEGIPELLSWANMNVHKNAPSAKVGKLCMAINEKDAPVLAGALAAKASFLVTLDQKDFFTEKLVKASLPIAIVTPRMYFQEYGGR